MSGVLAAWRIGRGRQFPTATTQGTGVHQGLSYVFSTIVHVLRAVLSAEMTPTLCFKTRRPLALKRFLNTTKKESRLLIKPLSVRPSYVTMEITNSFFARGVVEKALHFR